MLDFTRARRFICGSRSSGVIWGSWGGVAPPKEQLAPPKAAAGGLGGGRAWGQALAIGRPSRSYPGPKVKWTDLRWLLNHRCLLKLSCWSSAAIKFLVSSADTTVGVTQRPIQGFVFLDQGVYCRRWHFLLKHQRFEDFWQNYQDTSVYSFQLSCSAINYGPCKNRQLKIYVMPVIELSIKNVLVGTFTEDASIWFVAHEPHAHQIFS